MDAFERQARALAHSIPVCDLGSREGIKAVAVGLRETWRMAQEASDGPLRDALERIVALTPQAANTVSADGHYAAVRAIAVTALKGD